MYTQEGRRRTRAPGAGRLPPCPSAWQPGQPWDASVAVDHGVDPRRQRRCPRVCVLIDLPIWRGICFGSARASTWEDRLSPAARYAPSGVSCVPVSGHRRATSLISCERPARCSCPGVRSRTIVCSPHWKHWPCLFPQHGPGRKHERRWTGGLAAADCRGAPGDFLAGCSTRRVPVNICPTRGGGFAAFSYRRSPPPARVHQCVLEERLRPARAPRRPRRRAVAPVQREDALSVHAGGRRPALTSWSDAINELARRPYHRPG